MSDTIVFEVDPWDILITDGQNFNEEYLIEKNFKNELFVSSIY